MRRLPQIIGIAFIIAFSFSCAKVGSPTGGPKDTKSPAVKKSYPESGTVNFSESYFEIQFDEYVKLNNIQQNLIVSPPFSEAPKVKIKGKGIRVVLPEEPEANTTYSFTFLDAVSDITENNAAHSLVYAFSTGPVIDSLRVSGKLEDAFTGEKLAGVYVMLYKAENDSAFRTRQPDYLTMTNNSGEFAFFYLAEGSYRIYALEDANYSYSFDQPNERIAFLDSVVVPRAEMHFDTIDSVGHVHYYPENLVLRVFEEENKRQYVASSERIVPGCLNIVLAKQKDEYVKWESPDFTPEEIIFTENETKDSLYFYLKSAELADKDSLQIFVTYNTQVDTIGYETDSIYFPLPEEASEFMSLISNQNRGQLHYFNELEITADGLIQSIDTSLLFLYHQVNDSTEMPVDFEIAAKEDGLSFLVKAKLREDESYRFAMDSLAVSDVLNRKNDSVSFEFTYRKLSSYSELKLNVKSETNNFYCQLLSGDKVIKQVKPDAKGVVMFDFLEPGKYDVRLVFDENGDYEWTSGELELHRQPEKVLKYPSKIELRANWQQETDWVLNE